MSHTVVMQISNEDGEPGAPDWHALHDHAGGVALVCTGEYVELGSRADCAEYTPKEVKRGGITCPHCLEKIRYFKGIRL